MSKATPVLGEDVGKLLVESFGLEEFQVTRICIDCAVGKAATVSVDMLMDSRDVDGLVELMRRYTLLESEVTGDE